MGGKKSLRGAAWPDADIQLPGTSRAVAEVGGFLSIDVNAGIDVATFKLDADIPPAVLIASTAGFPWRVAR